MDRKLVSSALDDRNTGLIEQGIVEVLMGEVQD